MLLSAIILYILDLLWICIAFSRFYYFYLAKMGRRKKSKGKTSKSEPEDLVKAPHSFVIKRGDVGKHVNQLMHDFRVIMEPFTASNLKLRKKNVIKDFVSISSYLNVSHLAIFTRTDKSPYFRLCRLPRGPTITYKVVEYSLAHDVISSIRKPHINSSLFHASPLLVLNGFSNDEDLKFKLMTSMWRNMFPTIDIQKVQLGKIKRCVLLNYDQETGLIELRHYSIKVKPVGLTNAVRKLMTGKKVPDLGSFTSVEEAIERAQLAAFTESEGEGDEHDEARHVTLSQKLNTRGNLQNEKSSIRLVELGPRLTLELVKIEEGIMDGEVLYHSYISKTKEEVQDLKKAAQQKVSLKMARKKAQEENVKRKAEERGQQKETRTTRRANKVNTIPEKAATSAATIKPSNVPANKRKASEDDDSDGDYGNPNNGEDPNFSDYQISDDDMLPLDDADE